MHPTEPSAPPPPLLTDLGLEGGGVKGVRHVGAVMRLVEAGYSFPRVAGTSAGAIVETLAWDFPAWVHDCRPGAA